MSLAESVKEAASQKTEVASGADKALELAEKEAEDELAAALEGKDVKRIRKALRAIRDLDD